MVSGGIKTWIGLVAVIAFLSGCGKNDAYWGAPFYGSPIVQAPGFPGGGFPGSGYYPPGTPYNGRFQPQLPGGFPSAYTPFLPVDYFMRNHPQFSGQWGGFWNQWVHHSNQIGVSPYDFNHFWFNYCPQVWNQGMYLDLYVYLDRSFYHWMQPQTAFGQGLTPAAFWSNYNGYHFGSWY